MSEKRNIIVHWFIYSGDEYLLEETFHCAHNALPEARFIFIDDANMPCSQETQDKLCSLGAEWRVTSWSRGGNLRGKACILGILSAMQESATSDQDVLVKFDADTCLLDGEALRRFAASDKKIWAYGHRDERIYGCAYAMPAHLIKQVRDYIEGIPLAPDAPEDIIIGFSAFRFYPEAKDHQISRPRGLPESDGMFTAYRWEEYPRVTRYVPLTVVTVGNRAFEPLTKKQRLYVMENLRKEREAYRPPTLNN